jgi:hypothetical protein
MNFFYKTTVFSFFVVFTICCPAQQMVQLPKDILTVCQKDDQFIGKPLKVLFNEIKPRIILVLFEEGGDERTSHFTFFFTTKEVFNKYRQQNQFPLRITIVFKEPFKWTWEGRNRSKDHYLDWTKEDEEKYGHLTITSIWVGGEYNECDYEYEKNL